MSGSRTLDEKCGESNVRDELASHAIVTHSFSKRSNKLRERYKPQPSSIPFLPGQLNDTSVARQDKGIDSFASCHRK
ncbi:unnamed protein product [Haemonchus placei]|uniref:Uncharacterized protein n=1 Tax=Haemonchus placei TaxID=6290 RepID=A0A0N4WMP3_HAEPC|nr:unnamed protein product [Haemonchus placei]